MSVALMCLAVVLAIAWLPILIKFFRNWRNRANPISLAICFVVAFAMYTCLIPMVGGSDPQVTALVVQIVNAVTCLFFHVSFGWAKKRWTPGERPARRGRSTDYPDTVDSSKNAS